MKKDGAKKARVFRWTDITLMAIVGFIAVLTLCLSCIAILVTRAI